MSGTMTPATPGVVVFDYANWVLRFPQFANISEALATLYFDDATLYLSNTPGSVVANLQKRAQILNLLTAHIAELAARAAQGGLVGRISNASEGSVSVGSDLKTPQGAAWFEQTSYGLMAWQAMAPYRTFRFIPGHVPMVRRW